MIEKTMAVGVPTRVRSIRRTGALLAAIVIAAVATALIAAYAIGRLHDLSDSKRRTELILAEIRHRASRLRLAELSYRLYPSSTPPTFQGWPGGLDQRLARLEAIDPGGPACEHVAEAVDQYRLNLEELLRLLAGGHTEAAALRQRPDRRQLQPSGRSAGPIEQLLCRPSPAGGPTGQPGLGRGDRIRGLPDRRAGLAVRARSAVQRARAGPAARAQ
jgi:hypothetical protein